MISTVLVNRSLLLSKDASVEDMIRNALANMRYEKKLSKIVLPNPNGLRLGLMRTERDITIAVKNTVNRFSMSFGSKMNMEAIRMTFAMAIIGRDVDWWERVN